MRYKSYWRERARPIIAEIIDNMGLENERALKQALFAAYPFGKRKYHPYKIWLDEIKRQTRRARWTKTKETDQLDLFAQNQS